jgi:hypothetical protein
MDSISNEYMDYLRNAKATGSGNMNYLRDAKAISTKYMRNE